jgi:hypothetical protein
MCDGTGLGVTTLTWTATGVSAVAVHINSPSGSLFSRIGPNGTKATGKWVSDGMTFYLQDVSNGLPLTSANTLATVTVNLTPNGCVAITQQPSSLTRMVGQSATFSVSATGAAPLTYQWRRNGVNIAGATSSSYTITSVAGSDNGAQFSCVVSNPYSTVTSNSATLTATVMLTVASSPSGLKITLDGPTQTAPFSISSVVGASHTLGLLSPQVFSGFTYFFDSWSDGGAASHSISTPGINTTYMASFRYNDAGFVSQSTPAGALKTGQKYNVSVTMRNTGTTTWTAANNYRLGSRNPQDNTTWGLSRVNLPASVAPGATVTFNFSVTSPARGDYNFQWMMVHDGVGWFGALTPNVVLKVR